MANNNINDWEDVAVDDWQDMPVDNRQPSSNQDDLSNLDVSGLAALQSLSFGGADELKAAIEAPFSDKTYEQIRDEERALYKKAEETNPGLYNTVGFASGVLPAITTGGLGLLKNAFTAAKAAPSLIKAFTSAAPSLTKLGTIGAVQGAAQGLGSSEADNTPDLIYDTITGAELGAGVGVGLGVLAPPIIKSVGYVAPKIKNFVTNLPLAKPLLRSRELRKQGIDVTSSDAKKRIVEESKKLAENLQESMTDTYSQASENFGNILEKSDKKIDVSDDLLKIEKDLQDSKHLSDSSAGTIKQLQNIINKYKQNKQILKKPDVPVKTGEEIALEKLAKKQAKLAEESKLKGESLEFTPPQVRDEFVTSSQITPGRAMVEPIPTGEFNPVKFIETPEITTKVVRPQTLAKTGEEKALDKLLQKQAKMTEEARVINELAESRVTEDLADDAVVGVEPYKFTDPQVSDEFISSAAFTDDKIKPMVESVPTGEFNPVKFLQEKTSKYEVQRPASLAKTGQETALEKMLQTQAKLKEQMSLQGKKVDFTEPNITDDFVTSSQISPGKPMVEPITIGEFSPIEIINKPELVANLNARALQNLKNDIDDVLSGAEIGTVGRAKLTEAKSIIDLTLKKKAINPELLPDFYNTGKTMGGLKDAASLVDSNLINPNFRINADDAKQKLSTFLREPIVGKSGDVIGENKKRFFEYLKDAYPSESIDTIKKMANDIAEQYEYNLASENIFGGVKVLDPLSLLGTGKGLAVKAGQLEGAVENVIGKTADAVQLDRTLARGLAKRSPKPLQDVLNSYNENRLKGMTLNAAMRKPTENVVESRNDSRQEFVTKGIDSLNKADTADLQAFSDSLLASDQLGAEKYASTLKKLAETESKNRGPLTFSLMSDPNFRQMYKNQFSPVGVEENED